VRYGGAGDHQLRGEVEGGGLCPGIDRRSDLEGGLPALSGLPQRAVTLGNVRPSAGEWAESFLTAARPVAWQTCSAGSLATLEGKRPEKRGHCGSGSARLGTN